MGTIMVPVLFFEQKTGGKRFAIVLKQGKPVFVKQVILPRIVSP